jgi:hypothetical protein
MRARAAAIRRLRSARMTRAPCHPALDQRGPGTNCHKSRTGVSTFLLKTYEYAKQFFLHPDTRPCYNMRIAEGDRSRGFWGVERNDHATVLRADLAALRGEQTSHPGVDDCHLHGSLLSSRRLPSRRTAGVRTSRTRSCSWAGNASCRLNRGCGQAMCPASAVVARPCDR